MQYAASLFPDSYEESYADYYIDGSTRDNDVCSYYCQYYDYYDNSSIIDEYYYNYITLTFDAVSGDLVEFFCCNTSTEEALRITNDVLALLGIDYIATADIIDGFDFCENCLIEGASGEGYSVTSLSFFLEE